MSNWFTRSITRSLTYLFGTWKTEQNGRSTTYTGKFIVWDQAQGQPITIPSCIIEQPDTPTDVYLCDPPRRLWKHKHGWCFQLAEPGSSWVHLHWEIPAYDFATARNYVQTLLVEALA
jgi:hypothetical protein